MIAAVIPENQFQKRVDLSYLFYIGSCEQPLESFTFD